MKPARARIVDIDTQLIRVAVYARKSNEQDATEEHKSVSRQLEHAHRFIDGQNRWHLEADFVDDGISGAEFSKRPGFVALMAAIHQTPCPFDVLVMSEGSRLGREQIETAYVMKQVVKAGIRVFSYLDGREQKLDTPVDKFMMQVESFADEMERHRTRARVTDALTQRARAGQVTGGRTPYGYRDTAATDANGHRTVTRAIDPAEAAIVQRIFQSAADGAGDRRIARELNADRIPPSRNKTGTRRGWAQGAIPRILDRVLYRGLNRWNKTSQANSWGERRLVTRDTKEWIEQPVPHLRIVSDVLWKRAHDRRAHRRQVMNTFAPTFRGRGRRPLDVDSPYLLVGFARCGECGGPLSVSQMNGTRLYVCGDRRRRGATVCENRTYMPMTILDQAIIRTILDDLLSDTMKQAIIDEARTPTGTPATRIKALRKDLAGLEQEIENLSEAIAVTGGKVNALVRKLTERQVRRDAVEQALEAASTPALTLKDRAAFARMLEVAIRNGRIALKKIPTARALLRDLFQDRPIKVWGTSHRPAAVRFSGEWSAARLFEGTATEDVHQRPSSPRWSKVYRTFEGRAAVA